MSSLSGIGVEVVPLQTPDHISIIRDRMKDIRSIAGSEDDDLGQESEKFEEPDPAKFTDPQNISPEIKELLPRSLDGQYEAQSPDEWTVL